MNVNKLYDRSDCIEIDKTKCEIYQGEKYYRIVCLRDFKDTYAKRLIKKGEVGGLVHEKSIGHLPSWIESNQAIGKPITETVFLQRISKEEISHSCILEFKNSTSEIFDFLRMNCGYNGSSLYNAYVTNSTRIAEFAEEMFAIEDRFISQSKNPTDSQMIVLWILLGAINEAVLKLHIVSLRIKYASFISKEEKFERMKVSTILDVFKADETLSKEEFVILSKINGNRNMIHFLNNESVYCYNTYRDYVECFFAVFKKLFQIEKSEYDGNIKKVDL